MSAVGFLDVISTLAFGYAFYVLASRFAKRRLGRRATVLLTLCVLIYVVVGVSNVLEHMGITAYFDRYEDFLEIVFVPFFIAFLVAAGTEQEIESRGRMEEILKAALQDVSNEKARTESVLDALGDGLSIQDRDFRIIYQNKANRDLIGDHIGEFCYEAYERKDDVCEGCPVEIAMREGRAYTTERSAPGPDGKTIYVEITASPLKDAEGNMIGGIEAIRNITKRKEAELELRVRNIAISSSINAIAMADLGGNLTYVNDAFVRLWGYDNVREVLGRPATGFWEDPGMARHVAEVLHKEDLWVGDLSGRRKDGSVFLAHLSAQLVRDDSGKPIGMMAWFLDITEHRRLEEQLRHAQKMEAIGTLTSGIAHEYNNIMTSIMGFSEFLQDEIEKGQPLRKYADMIKSASERAAKLTRGLLAYSRKQITHMEYVDLNRIVRDVEGFISNIIEKDITLMVETPEEELGTVADKSQMEQVFMNLATNAIDAIDARPGGGTVHIKTELRNYQNAFTDGQASIKPGTYAFITVTDTGVGMDEATRQRIFEPFFTTKDVGKGTGLGLSMVYGIVRKHDGYVAVESAQGKGSSFRIYLPIRKPDGEPAGASEQSVPETGASGTILVAEDDPLVRLLIKDTLERTGYRVIEARDGEEAVRKFSINEGKVDLLLLDLIMPRMKGKEAFDEIKGKDPSVKVLFISGYMPNDELTRTVVEAGYPFISKPVSPKKLLAEIGGLIARGKTA